MKYAAHILLLFVFSNIFSQNPDWGKVSQEEIEMKDVSFEPGAEAVKLKETGILTINNQGYELEEYSRVKILSDKGFYLADKKYTYNPDKYDKVILEDAQTINIIDGKTVITPIDKKDIFISKQRDNIMQLAFTFPNVREGSIIEYKIKIRRPNNGYASPWRFQNSIPTISSRLEMKFAVSADYKIITMGEMLNKKYGRAKNNRKWELTNIPSDKVFKNVYNIEDYRERIMFQYTSARYYYGSYYSENSWSGFKKLLNKDLEKSINKIDFKEIAAQIKNGNSKKETLQNCIAYIQGKYKWNRYYSIWTENLKNNFLKTKEGNTADFNMLLKGILQAKNISSELAVNSFRSTGKILVVYPVFSRLNTLVNIVDVDDQKKLMIDAAVSDSENPEYLPLKYFNQLAVGLDAPEQKFVTVMPELSEYRSQQNLILRDENTELKTTDQYKGYFSGAPFPAFSGVKTYESEEQKLNSWRIKTRTFSIENPVNSLLSIDNPLNEAIRGLEVETNRNYPVELDFPFLSTIQLPGSIPDGYTINTENFDQEISAFNGNMKYIQKAEKINGGTMIVWSLLVNKIFFTGAEINEYQSFVKKLLSASSNVAVIRKLKN